jgi:hypothetical protein
MSVLAGYDFVAEIAKPVLLQQLGMISVMLPGSSVPVTLNPPFELLTEQADQTDTSRMRSLRVHMIVTDINLSFFEGRPDGRIRSDSIPYLTVVLRFRDLSFLRTGLAPISSVNGRLVIGGVPIRIRPRTTGMDNHFSVLLEREQATLDKLEVIIDFTADSVAGNFFFDTVVNFDGIPLRGLSLNPSVVNGFGLQLLPLQLSRINYPFSDKPGFLFAPDVAPTNLDGTAIMGTLPALPWFRSVEVHAIDEQTIAICGVFFRDRLSRFPKERPFISSGHNLCVSLSLRAFHRLIFCPQIRTRLAAEIGRSTGTMPTLTEGDLPPTCGTLVTGWFGRGPVGLRLQGMTLLRLDVLFRDNEIHFTGEAGMAVPCADVHVRFTVPLQPRPSGTTLRMVARTPIVEVHVTAEPLCWLGLLLTSWWNTTVHFLALSTTREVLQGIVASLPVNTIPAVGGLTPQFNEATTQITSDSESSLTLQGNLFGPLPGHDERSVRLTQRTEVISRTLYEIGVYPGTGCMSGDWGFSRFEQRQQITVVATPVLMGEPVRTSWTIYNHDFSRRRNVLTPWTALDPSGVDFSETQLLNTTFYAFGPSVTQDITLEITLSADRRTLTLINRESEGNYVLYIRVRATDAVGIAEEQQIRVEITGDAVDFVPEYNTRLAECARQVENEVQRLRALFGADQFPQMLDAAVMKQWPQLLSDLPAIALTEDAQLISVLQHIGYTQALPLSNLFQPPEFPVIFIHPQKGA